MPKRKRRPQGMIAPTILPSFDAEDPDLLVVVIETPKGSRNKYAFESTERNDRVVCVEQGAHSFTHIKHVDALGDAFEEELEDFFVNYHQLSGKKYRYRILGLKGSRQGAAPREGMSKDRAPFT